jgi:Flp pilus assembly protein TadG
LEISPKKSRMGCSVNQTQQIGWHSALNERSRAKNKGQAMVEFTLTFILLLVVAWIPADFGLAFYTGQMALNASREGARLAAASNPLTISEIETETCKRLSSALFSDPGGLGTTCSPYSNARVSVALDGPTCNQVITVTVNGHYNFFFYRVLELFAGSGSSSSQVLVSRQTKMRWEHQDTCG